MAVFGGLVMVPGDPEMPVDSAPMEGAVTSRSWRKAAGSRAEADARDGDHAAHASYPDDAPPRRPQCRRRRRAYLEVILSSLDDYIARQPSLVTKKRQVVPVVLQRMQIADSLA